MSAQGVPQETPAPEADVQEQQLPVDGGDEDLPLGEPPMEADEMDSLEQARVVEIDEDEYR